ncbi:RHS repeat protein [Budviciaceae bacterium CWB-B4]|uniref:RHS repeat protein n=1 Tax=Limnobaculum xujianqingii TaxID=2738837 RepID=A0A9D7AHX9_9GAMM|nr:RHS repeat-associated core domain-containing protein [Limnobaculum xujianqingii]MBK5072971.1 RHS repeat protein [Limnobaculum xujianqingii]MBK5176280.1 RHS repeat protein [Limnobaculum xujianqingii]
MNRLTMEQGFDGRTQRYHYNIAGELIQSQDEGLTTYWHYDLAGRLIRRQLPDSIDERPNEEQWCYDQSGQLISVHHHSEGYPVSVSYQRDKAGNITGEQQIVRRPDGETLWQYQVSHQYHARGFLEETQLEGLPPLRWQTYGPGHLLGVALGDQHLIEFSRDRLHREKERRFGETQLHTDYDTLGRLARFEVNEQPLHPLSREHHYNLRGQMTGITLSEGKLQYSYDEAGRLTGAQRTGPEGLVYHQNWQLDRAGNRLSSTLPDFADTNENHTLSRMGNRIPEDDTYRYRYDRYGNLAEKVHKLNNAEVHHYAWDHQHRLVHYTRLQGNQTVCQAHYLYDPAGRRVGKQVVRSDTAPETFWYGWDGDQMVLTEKNGQRIYTVYYPQSFVPLLRIEGDSPSQLVSLAQKLEQQSDIVFPTELKTQFNQIEQQLRESSLTTDNQRWLQQLSLEPDYLASLLDPLPAVPDTLHLYHCDHLGTPLALMTPKGKIEWQAELDAWGNVLSQHSAQKLTQPIRLQGQQQDEESGLYYNHYRYYDPHIGRYISQDPIGLHGGINTYRYPLNPIQWIDPLGLDAIENALAVTILGPDVIPAKFIVDESYKFGQDMHKIVGGIHNGAADALRHCYWMCRMTQSFGPGKAYLIGKSHEEAGNRAGQPKDEEAMDLANNGVGISCGISFKRCDNACIEKYNNGELHVLGGSNMSPSTNIPERGY